MKNRDWRRYTSQELETAAINAAQAKIDARASLKKKQRAAKLLDNRVRARKRLGIPNPAHARPTHCECCGRLPGKKGLAVDHCHRTGLFRGWLCGLCNTGIGALGDSLVAVKRATAYLQRTDPEWL